MTEYALSIHFILVALGFPCAAGAGAGAVSAVAAAAVVVVVVIGAVPVLASLAVDVAVLATVHTGIQPACHVVLKSPIPHPAPTRTRPGPSMPNPCDLAHFSDLVPNTPDPGDSGHFPTTTPT